MWNRELLADLEAETFEPESLDEAGAADFEAGREEEAGNAWAGEEEAFPLGELDELDELDEILEAEATPRITRFGGRYRVVLTGFAFDRSNLPADAVARLKGLVDTVRASQRGPAPVRLIEVIGHTDPVGTDAYNLQLGCRRAAVVAARLRRMMDPQLSGRVRVRVASMGERQAVPGRDSFNRRVEIALLTTPRPRPPGSTRCPHVPGAGTPGPQRPGRGGQPPWQPPAQPREPAPPPRQPARQCSPAEMNRALDLCRAAALDCARSTVAPIAGPVLRCGVRLAPVLARIIPLVLRRNPAALKQIPALIGALMSCAQQVPAARAAAARLRDCYATWTACRAAAAARTGCPHPAFSG